VTSHWREVYRRWPGCKPAGGGSATIFWIFLSCIRTQGSITLNRFKHSLTHSVFWSCDACVPVRVLRSAAASSGAADPGMDCAVAGAGTCGDYLTMRHHGDTGQASLRYSIRACHASASDGSELPQLLRYEPVRGSTPRPVHASSARGSRRGACEGPWCSGCHSPMPVPTHLWRLTRPLGLLVVRTPDRRGQQLHRIVRDDELNRVHHVFPSFILPADLTSHCQRGGPVTPHAAGIYGARSRLQCGRLLPRLFTTA